MIPQEEEIKGDNSFELVDKAKETEEKKTTFEIISDESQLSEVDCLKELEEAEAKMRDLSLQPKKAEEHKLLKLEIREDIEAEKFFSKPDEFGAKTNNANCHSWFIVKDKGVPINWRKPLL